MMGENNNIDVLSTPQLADPVSTMTTILNGLCNKVRQIKTEVCSTLSKTSFNDVKVEHMHGRGNTKFTKEYLANNLVTLVGLVDCIDPIVNAKPPVLDIGLPSSKNTDHVAFVDSMQRRMDHFDTTINANEENINKVSEMLKQLETLCNRPAPSSAAVTIPPAQMQPKYLLTNCTR